MRFDIFPVKGQFCPGDTAAFYIENSGEASLAEIRVTALDGSVVKKRYPLSQGRQRAGLNETVFKIGGYGVEADFYQGEELLASCRTAFEVREPGEIIRYGFLSDFAQKDAGCEDVECMAKMHINTVQFYDWSWHHDHLVPLEAEYTDMMGKKNSLPVVKEKIEACHSHGMKAMGYGAIYAASKEYQRQHSDESLYDGSGSPLCFIDTFYLMNPSRECSWHDHIIEQYQASVKEVGFDGIHMDTYGTPKTALDAQGKMVYLEETFPDLIGDVKKKLQEVHPSPMLIFNNVGGWPYQTTMTADQEAVYIEVWPPNYRYHHLVRLIEDASLSGKTVILAAYPAPFRTDTPQRALESQLFLSYVIAMTGATQLFFGEENAVITQGYYGDYTRLSEEQLSKIRAYQDFFVRYGEIFYDKTLKTVSMTHQGWDNPEYIMEPKGSADGEPGTLWYYIRENKDKQVISILNLKQNDDLWNEGKQTPEKEEQVHIRIQTLKAPKAVWFASPDREGGDLQVAQYQWVKAEQGMMVSLKVPVYRCSTVVLELQK